jgi:hypothetical protein
MNFNDLISKKEILPGLHDYKSRDCKVSVY